ncbi:MAG TPA: histone deacetylase family protein [Dehalococcoidales bacterium]
MTVAILYQDDIKEYDFGSGHPFHGDRYPNFMKFLQSRLPADGLYDILKASPASEAELLKICDQDYIDFSREYYLAAAAGWIGYYENFGRYHSVDNKPIGTPGNVEKGARIIIGQARTACDLIQSGQYRKVISIGGGMHHAQRRFGEGFCVYNDVAFSALYLIEQYHLDRILVLDTDAHAGNGTVEYIRGNSKILYIDVHQDPHTIYPGCGFVQEIGVDSGKGLTINLPLPVHAGNASYLMAFNEVILPVVKEYQPQIIIRNGGSDPHFNDGLTYLGMTVAGFRLLGDKVRELAETCGGRQIDLIASGYNKDVLPYAWLSLLSGIADFPLTVEEPVAVPPQFEQDLVIDDTENMLQEVKRYHRDYWKCFR